jgi:hypothetical protein
VSVVWRCGVGGVGGIGLIGIGLIGIGLIGIGFGGKGGGLGRLCGSNCFGSSRHNGFRNLAE